MSNFINFEYKKTKSKEEAYLKVKSKVTEDSLKRMNVKADIYYDDLNYRITARGKGFTFDVDFFDTDARGDLELGFLLRPLEDRIKKALKSKISTLV